MMPNITIEIPIPVAILPITLAKEDFLLNIKPNL